MFRADTHGTAPAVLGRGDVPRDFAARKGSHAVVGHENRRAVVRTVRVIFPCAADKAAFDCDAAFDVNRAAVIRGAVVRKRAARDSHFRAAHGEYRAAAHRAVARDGSAGDVHLAARSVNRAATQRRAVVLQYAAGNVDGSSAPNRAAAPRIVARNVRVPNGRAHAHIEGTVIVIENHGFGRLDARAVKDNLASQFLAA